jgi:riboflavin synthase
MALEIDSCGWTYSPTPGESIAVNGCCLTLVTVSGFGRWRFDVVHQTLGATNLGLLREGAPVNLEHAVTPASLLGGHIVQGHVDGVGVVSEVLANDQEHRVRIEAPEQWMRFIIHRGSIAVNGVSLTVAEVATTSFEVALIPATLQLTNLSGLRIGDHVNLETDYIAKIVANLVDRAAR